MQNPTTRKLKIDMADLETAFDNSSWALSYYLDLETGDVPLVTDDARRDLEQIYKAIDDADEGNRAVAFHEALARSNLPEWEKEAVLAANQVEEGYPTRYLALPRPDSRAGYHDMERFIETVESEHLRERLWKAIDGRGAFRRFKDELFEYPAEQQRWFAFRDARLRQRVLDWLAEESIEPIIE